MRVNCNTHPNVPFSTAKYIIDFDNLTYTLESNKDNDYPYTMAIAIWSLMPQVKYVMTETELKHTKLYKFVFDDRVHFMMCVSEAVFRLLNAKYRCIDVKTPDQKEFIRVKCGADAVKFGLIRPLCYKHYKFRCLSVEDSYNIETDHIKRVISGEIPNQVDLEDYAKNMKVNLLVT